MLHQAEDEFPKSRYRGVFNGLIHSWKSGNRRAFAGTIVYYSFVRLAIALEHIKGLFLVLGKLGRQEGWFRVNDYSMILPPSEKGIVTDLRVHRIREPYSTKFFNSLIDDDDIVVDIGANIGYYSILESFAAPRGKVFAIEPVERNIQMLRSNLELNGCRNVHPFALALSDSEGKRHLYVYDAGNLSSFVKHGLGNIVEEADIETMTLDSFVQTHMKEMPDVIRMDLEGFECHVLAGARKVLSDCENLALFIEIHPSLVSSDKIEEMLNTLENGCFRVDAIFIEPLPFEYELIGLANFLRGIAGIPRYGCAGSSFSELRDLLSNEALCRVFFSRGFAAKRCD